MTDIVSVFVDSNNCSNGCSTCVETCTSGIGSVPYIFCSLDPCFCCDQTPKKKYNPIEPLKNKPPLQKQMSRIEIQF